MIELEIHFTGQPGDNNDDRAHDLIHKHGGTVLGAGTFLPDRLRDIQALIPEKNLVSCLREFAQHKAFKVHQPKGS